MIHEEHSYRGVINVTFCWTFLCHFLLLGTSVRRVDPLIKNKGSFLPPQLCFKITASVAGVDTRIIFLKLGMTREISLNWGSRERRRGRRVAGRVAHFHYVLTKSSGSAPILFWEWTLNNGSVTSRSENPLIMTKPKSRRTWSRLNNEILAPPGLFVYSYLTSGKKHWKRCELILLFELSTLKEQEFLFH